MATVFEGTMTPPRRPAVVTTIRLDPDVKLVAEEAARADGRTLSALIQKILRDWLRERDLLK
jgi:hypothetical protein